MKRKVISTALSVLLLWVAAFSVSAQSDDSSFAIQPTEQIVHSDSGMTRAENSGISNNSVYRIRNTGSGKYLNVHNGVDTNATNVYQWTYDGSTEQKWRVAYNSGTDSYQLYSMSSSGGVNRLLDISRGGAALSSGQNAQIWTPTDTLSHEMKITAVGTGLYKITMKGNTNLCLTAYGSSNGTSDGRTSTSAGNVFISTYTGSSNQIWAFEDTGERKTPGAGGFLDSVSSTKISGWAWRGDLPNSPIHVHIYLTNNTTGEVYIRSTLANVYRQDLLNAGYGNGYHGYSYSVDWTQFPSGNYTIHTYAIGGGNPLLHGSPKSYSWDLGYLGYAVYRDLKWYTDIFVNNWHAGLMNKPYANNSSSVIHAVGSNNNIQKTSWNGFVDGEPYYGVYRPKENITDSQRIAVIALARELDTRDIGYIATHQMQANLWPDRTKIEPDAIVSLRCDGLIEYCYEYYGIRIFGSNSYWDISVSSAENLAHHNHTDVRPKRQAEEYMILETIAVPNS